LPLERFHQRRFLTDFIRPGATMLIDVKVAPAAKNVLADEALGVGIANRLLHDARQSAGLYKSRARFHRRCKAHTSAWSTAWARRTTSSPSRIPRHRARAARSS